jgi:hypothetical protein
VEELNSDFEQDEPDAIGTHPIEEEDVITIGEPEEGTIELTSEQIAELDVEKLPKIKEFRKAFKETARKNKELEARIKELEAPVSHPGTQTILDIKPTLESCDYDAELYEAQLLAYADIQHNKKERDRQLQLDQAKSKQEWDARMSVYNASKQALKVQDFAEHEAEVIDVLSVPQQGLIVTYCKQPAAVVYALGKHPDKLKELGLISDPIAFTLALKDIENEVRVTRKVATQPERTLTSTGAGSASGMRSSDAKLEKLREQAAISGDFTEVARYKRQLAEQSRAR